IKDVVFLDNNLAFSDTTIAIGPRRWEALRARDWQGQGGDPALPPLARCYFRDDINLRVGYDDGAGVLPKAEGTEVTDPAERARLLKPRQMLSYGYSYTYWNYGECMRCCPMIPIFGNLITEYIRTPFFVEHTTITPSQASAVGGVFSP